MDTGREQDHADQRGSPSSSEKPKRSRLLKELECHSMVGIGRVEDHDGKLFAFYSFRQHLTFAFFTS